MPAQGIWLECNGQSTAAYPALAAIVGANVPDYRGIFLRGYGSQTSTHYGTITHSSASLGTLQGDTIRNITGIFGAAYNWSFQADDTLFRIITGGDNATTGAGWNHGMRIDFDASRVVPVANENRPINKAVRYLMKAA